MERGKAATLIKLWVTHSAIRPSKFTAPPAWGGSVGSSQQCLLHRQEKEGCTGFPELCTALHPCAPRPLPPGLALLLFEAPSMGESVEDLGLCWAFAHGRMHKV